MHQFRSLIFVFLMLLSISNAHANNYNLDINGELVDTSGVLLEDKDEIPVEQNLAIHFTVINKNDFWINVNNLNIKMSANQDSNRFYPISSGSDTTLIEEVLIPPNKKAGFYVVLEEYNSLNKNERIGNWAISFETTKGSTHGYSSSDLTSMNYFVLDLSKPNNIEFNVIKEEAQLDDSAFSLNISPDDIATTNNLLGIVVAIIAIGGVLFAKNKKK
ncbi:hypothetical protein [uncultured Methanolobus sp.]|uniref:hypothetical protein n=1 Tax=uncultured Methanolobus sp. TaxID=218300 RepID=UPI002AAC1910|nr:hypothetical protein [uncultured Methanolobus sp.]